MPISALIKVFENNQLTGVPCMPVKHVKTYGSPSPGTPKGRTTHQRTGIKSSSKQQRKCENNEEEAVVKNADATQINCTVPAEGHGIPDDEKRNNIFCFAALADKNVGVPCT